jgi:ATP-dependent DNA ligase
MDAADGELMFRHACALGLEGIVSKRATSRYKSGRCDAWRKIKNTAYERRAPGASGG